MANLVIGKQPEQKVATTLGEVLYAKSRAAVPEQAWTALVQSVAAGDERALHALYEMAHRVVFTLMVRMTANRETAEELTIDVFHDVWRRASRYEPASGSVLGWIMNQARSRAIDRLRFESRKKRAGDATPPEEAMADPRDVIELRQQGEVLRAALATLTPGERQAIEMTFFGGLTHAEAAVRLDQPLGTIKTRIQAAAVTHRKSGEAMTAADTDRCGQSEATCAYALQILPVGESAAAAAHIASCPDCRREVASLRRVIESFVSWPTDVLRPAPSLQTRLALRIAADTGKEPVQPPPRRWREPEWEEVSPGIECKLLASDPQRQRISMLVRLAPGASYPAHTHAAAEELHLLDGELWIDGRKLYPGDYNYGEPGAGDERVWSETGCTCLLVTSTNDLLS